MMADISTKRSQRQSSFSRTETDIKTISAVHSRCPLWVIRCGAIQRQRGPMSVVGPIGDKFCGAAKGREVPHQKPTNMGADAERLAIRRNHDRPSQARNRERWHHFKWASCSSDERHAPSAAGLACSPLRGSIESQRAGADAVPRDVSHHVVPPGYG